MRMTWRQGHDARSSGDAHICSDYPVKVIIVGKCSKTAVLWLTLPPEHQILMMFELHPLQMLTPKSVPSAMFRVQGRGALILTDVASSTSYLMDKYILDQSLRHSNIESTSR